MSAVSTEIHVIVPANAGTKFIDNWNKLSFSDGKLWFYGKQIRCEDHSLTLPDGNAVKLRIVNCNKIKKLQWNGGASFYAVMVLPDDSSLRDTLRVENPNNSQANKFRLSPDGNYLVELDFRIVTCHPSHFEFKLELPTRSGAAKYWMGSPQFQKVLRSLTTGIKEAVLYWSVRDEKYFTGGSSPRELSKVAVDYLFTRRRNLAFIASHAKDQLAEKGETAKGTKQLADHERATEMATKIDRVWEKSKWAPEWHRAFQRNRLWLGSLDLWAVEQICPRVTNLAAIIKLLPEELAASFARISKAVAKPELSIAATNRLVSVPKCFEPLERWGVAETEFKTLPVDWKDIWAIRSAHPAKACYVALLYFSSCLILFDRSCNEDALVAAALFYRCVSDVLDSTEGNSPAKIKQTKESLWKLLFAAEGKIANKFESWGDLKKLIPNLLSLLKP